MKRIVCLAVLAAASALAQIQQSVIDNSRVGPQLATNGANVPLRSDKTAALTTTDAHGRYQEAVLQGNVYTANTIQTTITAAMNSPLGAAGTPLVGLFNPGNSGKNLVVLQTVVCTASGTAAAQPLFVWNVIAAPAGITAAGTAGINNLTFTSNSAAKVFAAAVTTGSAAATALRPIGGTTAIAAGFGPACTVEETAGALIVQPGAFAGVAAGNGAGTTWIVSVSVTWEEVVIP